MVFGVLSLLLRDFAPSKTSAAVVLRENRAKIPANEDGATLDMFPGAFLAARLGDPAPFKGKTLSASSQEEKSRVYFSPVGRYEHRHRTTLGSRKARTCGPDRILGGDEKRADVCR